MAPAYALGVISDRKNQLPWNLDPVEAFARWPAERPLTVLHSGRTDKRWSRWSLLAEPHGFWRSDDGRSVCVGLPDALASLTKNHPFGDLQRLVEHDDALWAGYLGYDLGRQVERIGSSATRDRRWPDAVLARCPGWLVHDRVTQGWWACGAWADDLASVPALPDFKPEDTGFRAGPIRSDLLRRDYEAKVRRALEYIAAGDVFQVNLTRRLGGAFRGSTRSFYRALAERSPAWYGASLELPRLHGDDTGDTPAIASVSPELFFELSADGRVTTRPIKGTRPAGTPPGELEHSAKDRAELAMIVDLLRNDLGRVCDYGSVRVEQARVIEHHPTVQHGVATVAGRLHASRGLSDLLRAVIPGGSITGAPKVRAMQIIEELEPTRRGPYCGAIGWLRSGTTATGARGLTGAFNLAIRTATIDQGRVEFGVGGGLVADSDPAAEYEETVTKARAVLDVLESSSAGCVTEVVAAPASDRATDFATVFP